MSLHPLLQFTCGSQQAALRAMHARADDGRDVIKGQVEIPMQNQHQALGWFHGPQCAPQFDPGQDSFVRWLLGLFWKH